MAAIVAGAVGGSIPNIFGGFAPFPNTIATALLAYQSEAIGFGFGIKFQYAKRLIGAMSNEEFNALTPGTIGNLITSHNIELIQRMELSMPKWIDIQQHYIEAGVQVEVMKANRTPSAWAEIITAFAGAAGQQVAASLNGLPEPALQAILASNPILSLIYGIANSPTSPGGTDPGTDPGVLPEQPPLPEPDDNSWVPPVGTNWGQLTDFTITKPDPISGGSKTWTSPSFNLQNHIKSYNLLLADHTVFGTGGSQAWASQVLNVYRLRIDDFYDVTI